MKQTDLACIDANRRVAVRKAIGLSLIVSQTVTHRPSCRSPESTIKRMSTSLSCNSHYTQ
jgi:hypothetical protein